MMAGAILTQRARWESAAAAARRLGSKRLLRHDRLAAARTGHIAALIRPCGDHRAKARRLVTLARFLHRHGGPAALAGWQTPVLREALLSVHGIGPETADVILLYAYRRPVFVADAYALKLLGRVGFLRRTRLAPRYAPVHARVTQLLAGSATELADLHAVIVEHGKELCGSKPRCERCFLAPVCDYGRRITERSRRTGR
jgi:endonuclease-3 related protein